MRNACFVVIVFLMAIPAHADETRVFDIQVAGSIAEIPLTLSPRRAGQTIELRNADASATPILHVLGPAGDEAPGIRRMAASQPGPMKTNCGLKPW
jgi:hypothetical protein